MIKDILPELNGKDYIASLFDDYEIRFCKESEYAELIDFLKKYWKEDHIFVLSKEVLDFQHLDKKHHRYNFVIAKHKDSKEIHSILGFVPTNHYDEDIKKIMVWPCIWKSRDDIQRKGLGVSLYYYLKMTLQIEAISILSISGIALSIYKHWNFKTGKIEQYFLPNLSIKSNLSSGFETFSDIKKNEFEDLYILQEYSPEQFKGIPDNEEIFLKLSQYKSKKYYINRFLMHPVYKYKFYTIRDANKIVAIIITRVCGIYDSKCLRIVDFIGDIKAISNVVNQLLDVLEINKYEYIDFIEVGLNDEDLLKAGFKRRKSYPDIIVPNYFEPYLKKNVDLDYAYKTLDADSKMVFFKADADQDRPNILSNLDIHHFTTF